MRLGTHEREIRHFHLCGGMGGGALGFNRGRATAGNLEARFRCIGGVDVDADACADFEALVGVKQTCLDMFTADQYTRWHGHAPPPGWREATAADIRAAAGGECPHIVFTSSPCVGFSGLLAAVKAASDKYQAMNELTLRSIALTLEAWADDPPEFILFENVPRIAHRGRPLLEDIVTLLRCHGYAVAETTHDCGVIGGLGQTRTRFLLVARHIAKVPPFLYEPPSLGLRTIGDVLGDLPLPGEPGWAMHGLPALDLKTWLRLALIEAGRDWRSLQDLQVVDGVLRDLVLLPQATSWYPGAMGVRGWDTTMGTIGGETKPSNGAFSLADPRCPDWRNGDTGRVHAFGQYGVRSWDDTSGAITGQHAPGGGPNSLSDPRIQNGGRFNNVYRVVRWAETSPAMTAGACPSSGGLAIQDPRVAAWNDGRAAYTTGGHYGIIPWDATAGTVTGHVKHDRGPASVQDTRTLDAFGATPGQWSKRSPPLIVSLDGCWHRPITTLEAAALQGFPAQALALGGGLVATGRSDSQCRREIGNAVPPPSAEAIAGVIGRALLASWSGIRVDISRTPIWVQQIAVPISIDLGWT